MTSAFQRCLVFRINIVGAAKRVDHLRGAPGRREAHALGLARPLLSCSMPIGMREEAK
jgi:hypothetical protein